MNYTETIDYLFSQLPMYQNAGKAAYKEDLSNTIKLCAQLGNPERKFKSIHLAGTNGKGSCSHMLASIFQEAGYTVGLYTSPHLKDFRERIRLNGVPIPEEYVIDFVEQHKDLFASVSPSFFEWTVALAFHYFAKEQPDIAIIETGLGGRLDSTNVVNPELSIITNIGLDHMDLLGGSLEKIALEKAGIIKANTPIIMGNVPGLESIFETRAKALKAPIYFSDQRQIETLPSDLKGKYQKENIRTVNKAIEILKNGGWALEEEAIRNGFLRVQKNTQIRGRWEQIAENPMCIADTAHNEEGLKQTIQQVLEESAGPIHFVLGFVKDKRLDNILALFPKHATYYFCAAKNRRSIDQNQLLEAAHALGLQGKKYESVTEAYLAAREKAKGSDFIYVGGSTFVVAEVI